MEKEEGGGGGGGIKSLTRKKEKPQPFPFSSVVGVGVVGVGAELIGSDLSGSTVEIGLRRRRRRRREKRSLAADDEDDDGRREAFLPHFSFLSPSLLLVAWALPCAVRGRREGLSLIFSPDPPSVRPAGASGTRSEQAKAFLSCCLFQGVASLSPPPPTLTIARTDRPSSRGGGGVTSVKFKDGEKRRERREEWKKGIIQRYLA